MAFGVTFKGLPPGPEPSAVLLGSTVQNPRGNHHQEAFLPRGTVCCPGLQSCLFLPLPPGVFPCPVAPTLSGLSLRGAVMPEDRFACGEKRAAKKNEFAFLNGTQCGNQSRGGFRCHSAPHRGCVKRQHPVCWQRARPVSPGCPCVPGNCCCRAAPAPGTGRGC